MTQLLDGNIYGTVAMKCKHEMFEVGEMRGW